MRILLKDNTKSQPISEDVSRDDLQRIANAKIDALGDILVYPPAWKESKDNIKDSPIITLEEKDQVLTITTGNVMGFIGIGKTKIAITSRFAEDEG
jgi:hypothetical protein